MKFEIILNQFKLVIVFRRDQIHRNRAQNDRRIFRNRILFLLETLTLRITGTEDIIGGVFAILTLLRSSDCYLFDF